VTKESFEVLLSAMHLKSWRYINSLNITGDCVVINQCDCDDREEISDYGRRIKFISSKQRGLSRSRNMAIENSEADVCIICDNDVEYIADYEKIILSKFSEYPYADIIVFFIKRDENSKPYANSDCKLSHKLALKVFSPEIAFRRKSLNSNNIRFKEEFGAGSRYMMGEENIFLYECLRKKLKVIYTPTLIANLRYEESTWKTAGINEKYFKDRGASFYAMSPILSVILNIQFAIRKRRIYDMPMLEAFRYMQMGRKEYKRSI